MNSAVDTGTVERRDVASVADRSKPSASGAQRTSPGATVAGIFINYRREDSAGYAGRLGDDLIKQFGADRVFMDVTDIAPGVDFRREIEQQVAACGVTLVMIGKSWLLKHGTDSGPRLSKPDDFVRLEIAAALKRDIPVIPVLVDGAAMPSARDLPADLEALAWRNAVELRHAYWETDLQVLVEALKQIIPACARDATPLAADAPAQARADDIRVVPVKRSWRKAIVAVAGSVAVAVAVGVIMTSQPPPEPVEPLEPVAPVVAPPQPAEKPSPLPTRVSIQDAHGVNPATGMIVISAVGLADPSNPRYDNDKSLLQSDARADSNRQLVEKALGLLIDRSDLATNYDVLETRLLSRSDAFIDRVVRQDDPQMGKDGFVSITTQAVVNVKALQRSLNEMSRHDRVQLIRASGDPRISLSISVRDSDQLAAQPRASPVAENLLKERIKSFGFRTWSDEGSAPDGRGGIADFTVQGEATLKKLSMRLEASGIVITKFTLTSWTVKCIDRTTGEEIYFNTTLPKAVGSWASEEQALKAIGAKVADEFSRDFFLQHLNISARAVLIAVDGMPSVAVQALFERELVGLPAVITAMSQPSQSGPVYALQLAGGGPSADIITDEVLGPLNAKLGHACFAIGAPVDDRVSIVFDKSCSERPVLARLETYPPAALYGSPPGRQLALVKNPDTLRKLTS